MLAEVKKNLERIVEEGDNVYQLRLEDNLQRVCPTNLLPVIFSRKRDQPESWRICPCNLLYETNGCKWCKCRAVVGMVHYWDPSLQDWGTQLLDCWWLIVPSWIPLGTILSWREPPHPQLCLTLGDSPHWMTVNVNYKLSPLTQVAQLRRSIPAPENPVGSLSSLLQLQYSSLLPVPIPISSTSPWLLILREHNWSHTVSYFGRSAKIRDPIQAPYTQTYTST